MGKLNKVWDRFAKSYAKRPVANEDAYQKKLQVTRDYLRPDMDVFEFGCGTGSTAIAHAPFVKHILAIDFSGKMLDIARRKTSAGNIENITFEQSGIDDFSVADGTFDVVMGHNILHLLDNRDEVVSKIYRMLKPGGVFVSSTMCIEGKFHPAMLILPLGRLLGLLPLVRFFPLKELLDGMTGAGFKIDHQWRPGKKTAVFVVAKKVG